MEPKENELIELLNGIKFIEKTYEAMRIIDPINHKVLDYKDNKIVVTDQTCHHFWAKEKSCDNCVSHKAYIENDTFIKLEYNKDKVFMVLAIPVTIDKIKVVVELLKDVTKNMLVVKKDAGETEIDVHSIINNTNNMLFNDHLTGVYNRRFIDERLQIDIINNSLHKGALSLIMADIDFFKNVNDTYGHLAGDYVLKEVAGILGSCIRNGKDWIARYGGEEFLVCLPNTDKDVAILIAERMRSKIAERVFEYEGKTFKLTTSFGIHSLITNEESNIESVINFADKNLYKAKQSGRNRVIS